MQSGRPLTFLSCNAWNASKSPAEGRITFNSQPMLHVRYECCSKRALELAKARIETRYPLLNVYWGSHANSYNVGICDDFGEQTRGMFDILCHYLELFATMGCDEAHLVLIDTSLPPLYGSCYEGRELLNRYINWRISDD